MAYIDALGGENLVEEWACITRLRLVTIPIIDEEE